MSVLPEIEAAFFCESFVVAATGHTTFNHIVQSILAPELPVILTPFAFGATVSGLPNDKDTALYAMFFGPDSVTTLNGHEKLTITLPPSPHGCAQVAYNVTGLQISKAGVYRLDFFFDGSTKAVHSARLFVAVERQQSRLVHSL